MIREVGVLLVLLSSLQSTQHTGAVAAQSTSTASHGPSTIVLHPNTTTAGQTIAVSGRGFTPDWTAWVFSPEFGDQMCCFMTSSTGSFEVNYTVPSYLQPGVYTVRGVDQKGVIADAKITIVLQTTSTVPELPGSASALALGAALFAASLIANHGRSRLTRESGP